MPPGNGDHSRDPLRVATSLDASERSSDRRYKRMKVGFVILATTLAVVVGGAYWLWQQLHTPIELPPGGAIVSVAPGEPFRITSERLQAAGVLRYALPLRVWARWKGLDRLVRSGEYR